VVAFLVLVVSLSFARVPARAERTDAEDEPGATGPVRDAAHRYQLVPARAWRPVAAPEGTLVAYQGPGGRGHLAVTRVDIGLRQRDADVLAAEAERGVRRVTPGFRRIKQRRGETGKVPKLDLWYERAGENAAKVILSRYLFFSRHTVVLSVGLENGASRDERRAAEAMLKSFGPFRPDD
jgi:hypothetical protein